MSGIATFGFLRCANRAKFLDSFEGKMHSDFITSPLADAKASVTSRRNFNFLEGAVYILLSQDYIGDNRFAKILYNFSGKAGEKTKLR